jgi:hypothetical protein
LKTATEITKKNYTTRILTTSPQHNHPAKTTNMSETLLSILLGEDWSWDPMGANQITFNNDGTGKVSFMLWVFENIYH